MRILDMTTCSIADGTGFRLVIWCAGCDHHCEGCHNPESWDYYAGRDLKPDDAEKLLDEIEKPFIKGVTFSGGDPLYDKNVSGVFNLCKSIKEHYPEKTIWLYTGYDFEDIYIPPWAITTQDCNPARDFRNGILKYIDVLVDRKFIKEQRDVSIAFRGSKNQRLIDVKKSLNESKVVLYEQE